MEDALICFGDEIKSLGEGRYGGYLVRFSTSEDPDLEGDYFTKDTDFGLIEGNKIPVLYHHGLDPVLKSRRLAEAEWKVDEVGVWIEYQLKLADAYEKAIEKKLLKSKPAKAGLSSQATATTVRRERVGKSYQIKSWHIAEGSITPTPAEPRAKIVPLKSLTAPESSVMKAESITARVERIRSAFREKHNTPDVYVWVPEVFDTHIIASVKENYYEVGYTESGDEVTFDSFTEWKEVEEKRTWVAKKSAYIERIKAEVKSLEAGTLEAAGAAATETAGADAEVIDETSAAELVATLSTLQRQLSTLG